MFNASHRRNQIGKALKRARAATGRTQEDFGAVSSRTYLSSLERGLKSPTLQKIDELAEVLGLHPLTLLTLAYSEFPSVTSDKAVIATVTDELSKIQFVQT